MGTPDPEAIRRVAALCVPDDPALDRRAESLGRRLFKHRYVKTVWNPSKRTDLNEFYYPSRLGSREPRVVERLAGLPADPALVVEGIVGQGKSMFLRYLASREVDEGGCVPIFVELRRLREGGSLKSLVLDELGASMGLELEEEVYRRVLESPDVALLFDGFDEIAEELRPGVLSELDYLTTLHPELRIVVTARPKTGIQSLVPFRTVPLAAIGREEIEGVVRRVSASAKDAEALIEELKGKPDTILDTLTTPLAITLVVCLFAARQDVPDYGPELFDEMFQVFLRRHDGTKPGYRRPRRAGLSDFDLRKAFDAFCFVAATRRSLSFSESTAQELARLALRSKGYDCDPGDFLRDVTEITCLLLSEGGERRFLHKSVLEYHSASHVAQLSDEKAERFYASIRDKIQAWAVQIEFLLEIDTNRVIRFLRIPMVEDLLATLFVSQEVTEISREGTARLFGETQVSFVRGPWKPRRWQIPGAFLDMDRVGVPFGSEEFLRHLAGPLSEIEEEDWPVLDEAGKKALVNLGDDVRASDRIWDCARPGMETLADALRACIEADRRKLERHSKDEDELLDLL